MKFLVYAIFYQGISRRACKKGLGDAKMPWLQQARISDRSAYNAKKAFHINRFNLYNLDGKYHAIYLVINLGLLFDLPHFE